MRCYRGPLAYTALVGTFVKKKKKGGSDFRGISPLNTILSFRPCEAAVVLVTCNNFWHLAILVKTSTLELYGSTKAFGGAFDLYGSYRFTWMSARFESSADYIIFLFVGFYIKTLLKVLSLLSLFVEIVCSVHWGGFSIDCERDYRYPVVRG